MKRLNLEFYDKEVKMIIVIRRDLKMRRGKEIAQASHACSAWLVEALTNLLNASKAWLMPGSIQFDHPNKISSFSLAQIKWFQTGMKKVTVRVNSEEELVAIHEAAQRAGLRSHLIVDSGLTEFKNVPTKTAVAIGPDESEKIDPITGELELY